jgi:hypothetical protein
MKSILKATSYLGLAITVAGPLLMWAEAITVEHNKIMLIVGMLLWFIPAIFWIKHDPSANA